jgi:IstB-like ATP binding protein
LLWVIPAPARPTPVWRPASRPVPFGELRSGFSVSFFTAAGLVHQLMEARGERRLLKLQAPFAAVKLLIIDALGYVPLLSSSKGTDRRGIARRDLSANVTNAVRPSSLRIFLLRNGRASSAINV